MAKGLISFARPASGYALPQKKSEEFIDKLHIGWYPDPVSLATKEPTVRRPDKSHDRPPLVKFLILAAAGVWVSVILTFLSFTGAIDAYWYLSIPRIVATINTGQLIPGSGTPGWDIIVAELSMMLGLPFRVLLFLPFGGLLLSVMAYSFIRRLKLSTVASALFVVYLATAILNGTTYSIFAHAWAYPMLFAIMLGFVGFARSSTLRATWSVLLAILFTALHLVYYTGELLAILFIMAFVFFAVLSRFRRHENVQVRAPVSLSIALFVLFVAFNQMLYQAYLPSISRSSAGESLAWLSAQLVGLLQGTRTHPQPYQLGSLGNIVTQLTSTVQILIIGAPVLSFLIYPIYRYLKDRRFAFPTDALASAIVFSLLLTSIGDLVVYFFLGLVSLRTVYLLLPVAGGLILNRNGNHISSSRKPMSVVFFAILLVLSAALLQAQIALGVTSSPSTLAQGEPGAKWFLTVQRADYGETLTDLRTATRLTLVASESGGTYSFHSYDSLLYGAVLGATGTSLGRSGIQYVVVDVKSLGAPIYAYNWTLLEPLVSYYPGFIHNPSLDKVYDDSWTAVFVNAA